jgi:MerR family transcriptional regulator, redox-sensitive transcriptional activator SoxR
MTTFSIGDIARQSGVPASTLRYYESIGLVPVPRRINKRRYYEADTIQRLNIIRFAQQAGFTLGEIQALFLGFPSDVSPSARWQSLAQHKLAELETKLQQLQMMRQILQEGIQCGCLTMEQCLAMLCNEPSDLQHQPSISR